MIGPRSIPMQLYRVRNPTCTQCGLHRSTTTVCVMGRGDTRSRVMLLGEAPGEAEARTGKPFMGASGQWMQQQIDAVGFPRHPYITNVCKCRPPHNRTPTLGEVRICSQLYLRREIEIMNPYVIVCLGRTAIDLVWKGEPFKRGEPIVWNKRRAIPTWHPAYCLRSGNASRQQFRAALELAKELAYANVP